jgi:ribonuclease HII
VNTAIGLSAVFLLLASLARVVQWLEMSRVDREAREYKQGGGYDSEKRTAAFVTHELYQVRVVCCGWD